MSAVFKCDLCGVVDETYKSDTEYCAGCSSRLHDLELMASNKTDRVLEKEYGTAVKYQVRTLNLIRYLLDEHRNESIKHFGTQGVEMMEKATQ